jgi:aspartate aminotransferase
MFSRRIRELAPSGTIALSNKVSKLKAEGIDVISFTLGEPDFATPVNVIRAAKDALDAGDTHYTPSMGIKGLREYIARHVFRKNGIKTGIDNIMVLPAKFALYAAVQAIVNKGEEVILPDPAWVSYGPMVQLAEGSVRSVPMEYENGWHLRALDIENAINSRTKAIVLNTPANPTGSVMTRPELEEIAKLAKEHDIFVIADEVYEDLIYEGVHHSIASFEGMAERTITVAGLSKSHAMTGWRIGWIIGNTEFISNVNKLQQHSLTCLPGFIQQAGMEALKSGAGNVEMMRREFLERRNMLIPLINSIPGLSCEVPKGAFYAFFRADLGMDSMKLSERLLEEAHVAMIPGSAFGPTGEGYMRMSYAASRNDIAEGMRRIKEFVEALG